MSYIDHFLNSHKPLLKPRIVCVEEDWEYVCHVFPETGFRSYFLGYVISQLARELREADVTSALDRDKLNGAATITGLLSNIRLTRQADNSDDRRRAGGTCEKAACSAGESADHALTALRETEEDENLLRQRKARLEAIRLVDQALGEVDL